MKRYGMRGANNLRESLAGKVRGHQVEPRALILKKLVLIIATVLLWDQDEF